MDLRSTPWLAKTGLLLVSVALIVKCVSLGLQIVLGRRIVTGDEISDEFVNLTANLADVANVLLLVTVVIAAITFIHWFHNAYKALADIDAAVHEPRWAVLSWFVPGLNLVRPAEIMGELTNQFSAGRRPKKARWTAQLWLWWGAWIGGTVIQLLLRLYSPGQPRGWIYWETTSLLAYGGMLISLAACWGLVERAALKQAGLQAAPPRVRPKNPANGQVFHVPENA